MSTPARKPYPSDVTDAEWEFLLAYLVLMREDAPQREYDLRELFNALRYVVKTGCQWRFLPHDFPPWAAVYQQARRWLHAGAFERLAHDLRVIARFLEGRGDQPTGAILDARTLQSTPESGARAGYDGAKRRKGSKVHAAVDTLGHLLALRVTAASEQERASRSGRRSPRCARPCRKSPGGRWRWRSSTRATPAPTRRGRRRGTAYGWRWSGQSARSIACSARCAPTRAIRPRPSNTVKIGDWLSDSL